MVAGFFSASRELPRLREISTVFRKIARKIAENARFKARVKPENLTEYLSKPRFYNEVRKRVASVGVATGMAYTPVGGDILFIETQGMPGSGKLVLTDTSGGAGALTVRSAAGYTTAASLGIDATTAGGSITGSQISYLGDNTTIRSLLDISDRYQCAAVGYDSHSSSVRREHRAILAAAQDGDGHRCRLATQAHIEKSRDRLLVALALDGGPLR